jgi:hypothetical protein
MSAAGTPYPRLPAAVLQETVEATPLASPDELVKTYLLNVTSEILVLQSSTTSLGAPSTDRYSPSLQVLHARLQHGHHSPFPGLDNRSGDTFARTRKPHKVAISSAADRPLGDFEDLYYAILATVKESHESIILRLNNGFVDPNALLFPSSQYTIHFFQEWLAHQWTILNEPSFVLALDIAVRKSLVDGHLCQGLQSQVESGQLTHEEAEVARAQLYESDVFADMPGLSWVGNEHSAMINGRLNEKYRVVFQTEKQAREKKTRWAKKKERVHRIAKTSPKAQGRRGSGEYRQQRRQAMAGQAQQAVDVFPVATEGQTPSGAAKQVERELDEVLRYQQVDQSGTDTQAFFQEEVEAWRLYTQQQMSSQRETQMQYHEDELRRKTPLTGDVLAHPQQPAQTTEHAAAPLQESLRGEVASCTPQRQAHPPTQRHIAPMQQDTPDASPSDQENAFFGASPMDARSQRVTEYQTWLRESASSSARWLMGQTSQPQSDMDEASLQVLHGMDTAMDMDMDMDDNNDDDDDDDGGF